MLFEQTFTEEEMIAFAGKLANILKKGDILHLQGDLGAGKSTFARALIRTALQDEDLPVPSPTFTLLQTYDHKPCSIWHYDLYRLSSVEEIYEIGFEEGIENAINLVEWPERLEGLTDKTALKIQLDHQNQSSRKLSIESQNPNWQNRFKDLS